MSIRVQGPGEICKELPYWTRRVLKVGLFMGQGAGKGACSRGLGPIHVYFLLSHISLCMAQGGRLL